MPNLKELSKDQLIEVIMQLQQENEKLRKQLRQFINENTPSGAIPPHLKPDTSGKTKRFEEKTGSKSANIRNKRPKRVDRTEVLELLCCPNCNGKVRKKKRINQRIVIKVVLPKSEKVKYKIPEYWCDKCKKEVRPKVPDALPNSKFDLTAVILMSVLFTGANISMDKISNLFKIMLGISISPASVANNLKKLKFYLGDEYHKIEEEIEKAKVRYYDETTSRKNGKTNYLWAVATAKAAYYRIEKTRCHYEAEKLPKSSKGVAVCDGYKAYDKISGKTQRCWAHLLRKADNPKEYFHSEDEFQAYWNFVNELRDLYYDAKKDKKECCSETLRKSYEKKLDKLLKSVKYLGKNSDAIMNYIMSYWEGWFIFLEYREVESTNNHAERMLRHAVLKRRISQQHRCTAAQRSYAMQLSIYMTSKLKNQNYIEKLRTVVEDKINVLEKY